MTSSRGVLLFVRKSDCLIVVRIAGNAEGAKGAAKSGSHPQHPPYFQQHDRWAEMRKNEEQLEFISSWEVRIRLRAQDKESVFNNLMKHVNSDTLHQAYKAIDGTKALGIDGVSKKEYGNNLKENLTNLCNRVQKGTYRPQPKREVQIPKANGKTRPIAISCFEDKMVDWVVGKILTNIYEPVFIKQSYGYRPNKSAHGAVEECYHSMENNRRPYVLEIDFSSFFNTIPHKKLMNILEKKIADNRFCGLIRRFLHSGTMTEHKEYLPSEIGTPQGGIASPILANIYLHEVIDEWFVENYASFYSNMVRYADDAVFFFSKENDALNFKNNLEKRVHAYGLKLNEDKTKLINLHKKSHLHFNFLGFTFYWGKQGSRIIFKIKTQKEKLHKAISEFVKWIKENRNRKKTKTLWEQAKSKLTGHFNYFGYKMNNLKINHFFWCAKRAMFKWLNRRSQKISYAIDEFLKKEENSPLHKIYDKLKWKELGRNFGTI